MLQPHQLAIPSIDPMPVPGPIWLMKTLLIVTFFLHLLFMNCALAGGITALFNAIRGRGERHPLSRQLAKELGAMLPVSVAFTVTLGVAALLFVQVLYGNLLYTSSILIGVYWLSVIVLVMVGYYGYYYFNMKAGERPSTSSVAVLSIAVLCFLTIGFIFTNNMTLMWTPEKWLAMYRARPSGLHLNLSDISVVPRYLHTIVGAFGVFSAALAHFGVIRMKKDPEFGSWLVRRSSVVFAITTVLQFLIGMAFLMTIPRTIAMIFFRDAIGVGVFAMALLTTLAATILLLVGGTAKKPGAMVHAGFGMVVITVLLMVLMRDMMRTAYLQPYFQLSRLQVAPQVGVIIVFLVTFVGGLVTLWWMLKKVAQGKSKQAAVSAR